MTFAEILKNIREILCSSLVSKLFEYLIFKTSQKSYLKTKKTPPTQHFKYDNIKTRHVVILKTQPAANMHHTPPTLQPSKLLKTIGITTAPPPLAVTLVKQKKCRSQNNGRR
jgi:hypothetical protein